MNSAAGGHKLELHAWYTKQRWRELEGEIDKSTVLVGQFTIPLLKILFIVVKYNIKFTTCTVLRVQFSGTENIHFETVQPSPPPLSRTFSSSQTEALYPLNNNFPFFILPEPVITTVLLSVSVNLITLVAVHSLSHVRLFATSWTTAHQASLSLTISWSLLRLMFIESVMPSNQLILYGLLQSFPAIFSNESTVGTTYKCNHTVFVLSWLSYLIKHNVIHVVTCVKFSSFLRVNNILVCVSVCISRILFIHLSMDGYLGCCHHLTIQVWPKYVVATTTRWYVQLWPKSNPLWLYSGSGK